MIEEIELFIEVQWDSIKDAEWEKEPAVDITKLTKTGEGQDWFAVDGWWFS